MGALASKKGEYEVGVLPPGQRRTNSFANFCHHCGLYLSNSGV